MKRALCLLLACLSIISIAILPLHAADGVEVATETIDQTTAYEDLSKATANGFPINMAATYPKDKTQSEKAFQFITFVEVGYKEDAAALHMKDYALYCYVYYPLGRYPITGSAKHNITLATAFDRKDANGNELTDPADWRVSNTEKFQMTLVNPDHDTAGIGYNTIPVMKFKVEITPDQLQNVAGDCRRYDVSEVEIHFRPDTSAKSFTVGHSFICSGYRKGYGNNAAKDNFTMSTSDIEVVSVKPEQTYYRYTNNADIHLQTQINTVYFAVPKEYGERFDKIDAIKCKWFEAHSTPMVVTIDEALYKEYYGWRGIDLYMTDKGCPERSVATYVFKSAQGAPGPSYEYKYYWQYNAKGDYAFSLVESGRPLCGSCSRLTWLIPQYEDYTAENREFADTLKDNFVPTEQMLDMYDSYLQEIGWTGMENASNEALFYTGLVDLFVDEGRTYGWQEHVIRGDISLEGYTYGNGFLEWWDKLCGIDRDTSDIHTEKIQEVNVAALSDMTDEMISAKYLIAPADVAAFKAYCNDDENKDCDIIVFHFAVTDYYSEPLVISYNSGVLGIPAYAYNKAYVAQETLFLDFDLIYLDYVKDGVNTIIPVAMTPMNIIPGTTPSVDQKDPAPDLLGGLAITMGNWMGDVKDALMLFLGILGAAAIILAVVMLINPTATIIGGLTKGSGSSKPAKKKKKKSKPKAKTKKPVKKK